MENRLKHSNTLTSPFVVELQKLRYELHWIVLLRLCAEIKCEQKSCCELYNRHDLWICDNLLSLVKKAAPHLKLILCYFSVFDVSLRLSLTHTRTLLLDFVCFVCCCFFTTLLFFFFGSLCLAVTLNRTVFHNIFLLLQFNLTFDWMEMSVRLIQCMYLN